MSTGKKLAVIPDKLAQGNKDFMVQEGKHYADAHFSSLKRLIENEKPYYKSWSAVIGSNATQTTSVAAYSSCLEITKAI